MVATAIIMDSLGFIKFVSPKKQTSPFPENRDLRFMYIETIKNIKIDQL